MNRTLAFHNALGTLCNINTLHPEFRSFFSKYESAYYVEVPVNPEEFNVYDLREELKPGLMEDVEIEIVYNATLNRDILRIGWRDFEEVKK